MTTKKKESTRRADDLTAQESAITLKKAFNKSGYATLKELADKLGLNYKTLGNYFSGHRNPTRERRDLIMQALAPSFTKPLLESKARESRLIRNSHNGIRNMAESERRAHLLKCAMSLALDQMEYFKSGTEADRDKLREIIVGKDVGYFTSLFGSLYDEANLRAWKVFSE